MKLKLSQTCIALILSCPLISLAQVTTGQQVIEETSLSSIARYALYVPDSYNDEPGKKWPLMLALHGTGGFEEKDSSLETNINILLGRPIPKHIKSGGTRFDEFIVISPQAKAGVWWNGGQLNTLVDRIIASHSIDTNRMVVTGLSMGGYGTYKTILNQPNKYAAAVPICPALQVSSVNEGSIAHMPIWIHHGDADPTVPYSRSVGFYDSFKAIVGGPETTETGNILGDDYTEKTTGHIKFTTYHSVKHNCWDHTYVRQDVIDWMFNQALPGANQAPELSISSSALSAGTILYGDSSTLIASATDTDGSISSIRIELNGELYQRADAPSLNIANFFRDLLPGDYTLQLSAIDNDGRENVSLHEFTIVTTPPPADSLTLINNTALNGSFETPASSADSADFWEDALGLSNSIQRELNTPAKASDGSDALQIGKNNQGEIQGAAIKTGYTLASGDSFYLSFNWRALDDQWDDSDAINWRLFATSDDSRNGSVTEIGSGSVGGYRDIFYRPFFQDSIAPTPAAAVGKILWLELTPATSALANQELALIDEVRLHVSTSGSTDTFAPTPNAALWQTAPEPVNSESITMTAVTGSDPSGPVEYYFEETSGNPGGNDSNWQTSPTYTDDGLSPEAQYSYVLRMRDAAGNTGRDSSERTATTTPTNATIRLDFGDDNQSPKIGMVDGGSWNTIHTNSSDPNTDIAVGAATSDLKTIWGTFSGVSIGSWVGNATCPSTNNQDASSYNGTIFNDGSNGDAGDDTLVASNNGGQFGFTLSGFQASSYVTIKVAAASRNWATNLADYTINGSYASNGSANFDVYANSNNANSGIVLTWQLTGSTAYTFLMDAAADSLGAINGMIIELSDQAPPPDTDPPTPRIAQWSSVPTALNATTIHMTASLGSDESGPVEYYFEETSGNPGGDDSGWQTSPNYTDDGLSPETEYSYIVRMRDALENTGSDSTVASASTPEPQPVNVLLRVDFGRDGQSNNIDVSNGKNWNTITTAGNYDLKTGDGANGTDTGYDLSLGSGWAVSSSNGVDAGAYKPSVFDEDGSLGEGAEFDVLRSASAGEPVQCTLSGFAPSDTIEIQLAAASLDSAPSNIADFTIDGAFPSNGGDNFDVYGNSQVTDGTGTILTWTLTGASSYTLTMDPADGENGAINGMIIQVTGAPISHDPDSDNDGLTDSEEATAGTDPNDPDSDGDGLSDGKEFNELGTDPNNTHSSAGGMDDLLYYALDAGNFDKEGQSLPTLVHAGNAFEFTIPKTEASDINYAIEISTDLSTWYRIAHKLNGQAWQKDSSDDTTPVYPQINDISVVPNVEGVTVSEPEAGSSRFYRSTVN